MSIKKINFNKPVLGLDSQPLLNNNEQVIIGKLLAQIFAGQNKGDAVKLLSWAMALYKGEELSLDPSDTSVIKDIIKDDPSVTIVVKAQILELIG